MKINFCFILVKIGCEYFNGGPLQLQLQLKLFPSSYEQELDNISEEA